MRGPAAPMSFVHENVVTARPPLSCCQTHRRHWRRSSTCVCTGRSAWNAPSPRRSVTSPRTTGAVAQWSEQRTHNPWVVGYNPTSPTVIPNWRIVGFVVMRLFSPITSAGRSLVTRSAADHHGRRPRRVEVIGPGLPAAPAISKAGRISSFVRPHRSTPTRSRRSSARVAASVRAHVTAGPRLDELAAHVATGGIVSRPPRAAAWDFPDRRIAVQLRVR